MKKNSTSKQIVTVTLNPTVDTVFFTDGIRKGESNRVQRMERDAGGKGINLARVVSKLGGDALATGFVGGGIGAHILAILNSEHVPNDFIQVKGESRESIFIESGDGPPTAFAQAGPFIKPRDVDALFDKLGQLLSYAGWLAMGGSVPPGIDNDIYVSVIQMARRYGCHVLVDADGEAMVRALEALPDLIKPNLREAERLLGRQLGSQEKKVKAATEIRDHLKERSGLMQKLYNPTVILSDGERDAVMVCDEGVFVGESPQVHVRSTIGSGDSMLGAFLWADILGRPKAECFQWGLAAGAATSTTNGSEICSRSMILQLLDSAHVRPVQDPACCSRLVARKAGASFRQ